MADLSAIWQASGLKDKILFTIVMIAVFRLGIQVPLWGVNAESVKQLAASFGLLRFLDMFSGGALASVSVLALGIGPYITASIMMQLLTVVIPRLEEMQKEEGEAGRRKISQITRYVSIGLAMFQGALITNFLVRNHLLMPGVSEWLFFPVAVLSFTAGAAFSLWIAEMITERGIGNGGSLLIFVGILSALPIYAQNTALLVSGNPQKSFALVLLLLIYMATIGLIIILQEASRKIFIVSAKRQVGNKIYGGQNTFIPFKINSAGVMPIIFAFAVLSFPTTLVGFLEPSATGVLREVIFYVKKYVWPGTPVYILLEFLLIVFFSFFYASIVPSMQPKEIAENLKKYGSSIPGIKPGKPTAEKLEEVLSRITLIGAVGLAAIVFIASSATSLTGITTLQGLGSTSLIILVGVALDTMNQIRVHLMVRQYEGFLK